MPDDGCFQPRMGCTTATRRALMPDDVCFQPLMGCNTATWCTLMPEDEWFQPRIGGTAAQPDDGCFQPHMGCNTATQSALMPDDGCFQPCLGCRTASQCTLSSCLWVLCCMHDVRPVGLPFRSPFASITHSNCFPLVGHWQEFLVKKSTLFQHTYLTNCFFWHLSQ